MSHRLLTPCVLAACAVLVCGCDRGPKLYTVSGEVTFQGQPVEEGEIVFADADQSAPTASGPISGGHYELQTVAGRKLVRITATKETGKMIEGAMGETYPERVDLIPAKYNTETTLDRTVDPQDERVFDFALQ